MCVCENYLCVRWGGVRRPAQTGAKTRVTDVYTPRHATPSSPITVAASADRAGKTEVRGHKSQKLPSCVNPRDVMCCIEPTQRPQAPREPCWLTGDGGRRWRAREPMHGVACLGPALRLPSPTLPVGSAHQPSQWVPTTQNIFTGRYFVQIMNVSRQLTFKPKREPLIMWVGLT